MTYRRTPRRTRWIAGLLVVGLTGLGVAGGWAVEHARGPRYEASTDVLVQFWGVQGYLLTGQGDAVSTQDVADAATLATSTDVLQLAADRLGDGQTADSLRTSVTVTPQLVSHGLTIVATGRSAAMAQQASQAVAEAMTDTVEQRITRTANGLGTVVGGDFQSQLQQRARVLMSSVQPLQVLRTAPAQQTGPSIKTPIMLGIVGLAAGVFAIIALLFARPVVSRARDAQRLVELPAVPFETPQGGPAATRLVRRLLESRPDGTILVVPVEADADKAGRHVADWARARTTGPAEAARVTTATDPVAVVLDPRPEPGTVAAVILVVPQGTPRRTLTDAVALLSTWHPVDAVVVPA